MPVARLLRLVFSPPAAAAPAGPGGRGCEAVLAQLGPDLADAANAGFPALAAAEAEFIRREHVRAQKRLAAQAAGNVTIGKRRSDAAALAWEQARALLAAVPSRSLVVGLMYLGCCVIGLGAELMLNLGSIPFLLDAEPDTVLGVALAAAPTVAVLGLEVIITRTLEQPFAERRRHSGRRRTWTFVAMGGFMTLVAVLIIVNVLLYAVARDEARQIMAGAADIDPKLLLWTVVALSVLIALSSAWFSSLALAELRGWYGGRVARTKEAQARASFEQAETAANQARAEATAATLAADQAADEAVEKASAYRAEMNLRLAMQLQPPPAPPVPAEPPVPEPTVERLVRQGLKRRMAERAGITAPFVWDEPSGAGAQPRRRRLTVDPGPHRLSDA